MEKRVDIFSPYRIQNIEIKNRIVLPPLVRFSLVGKDGYVTEKLIQWYGEIAKSGVGLIIVEASAVEEEGKLRENQIGIWNDSFLEGLKKVAEEIHRYGVPCLIQIHHAGFQEGIAEVAEEVLDGILLSFEKAFQRAKDCGFDGVEIHGAHSYLLSQLHSKLWNTRKDKYGEEMYFTKTLLERTRHLFDENFILGYRMGGNEPDLVDGIRHAKALEDLGVELLHVSTGIPREEYKRKVKLDFFPEDFPLSWVIYMGTEIKKHVKIPVIGVFGIKEESEASYLVENRLLDFVAVGRSMIAKPHWMDECRKDFARRVQRKQGENRDENG